MKKEPPITSPYAPDLAQVRAWLERMIESFRFVEIVAAVLALIGRMRELNAELTKQVANLRRQRPRSETLERLECQLLLPLVGILVKDKPRPTTTSTDDDKRKKSRKGRHPGRGARCTTPSAEARRR